MYIVQSAKRVKLALEGGVDEFVNTFYFVTSSTVEDGWEYINVESQTVESLTTGWEVYNCEKAMEVIRKEVHLELFWTVNADGGMVMDKENEGKIYKFIKIISKAIERQIVKRTVAAI